MLAYCIAERRSQINPPESGVAGKPIRWIDVGELRCYVSDFAAQMPSAPVPETVKVFNHVLQRIFAQAVIIPFRFPTIIESEDALKQFVDNRVEEYTTALKRLRNKVQIDIRITTNSRDAGADSSSLSGRKYLENRRGRYQRAQSILDEFKCVSSSLEVEWIQRDMPSGVRGFALIDASSLRAFLDKIAATVVPAGLSARVTGPWPPSEFMEIGRE